MAGRGVYDRKVGDRDELTRTPDPDLEAQYNMRTRIPDHPAIFARWTAQAAAYRAAARGALLDQAYGPHARHRYDLFPVPGGGARPLAVFLHGGYWQRMDRHFFSHLAAGPNALGVDAAVAQYRLCPDVRVADIFEDIRALILHLSRTQGRRLVLAGHSAGGQLAALSAAHDWARDGMAQSPIAGVLAISGVYDLRPLVQTSLNGALQLDPDEASAVSPLLRSPLRQPRMLCVVGADETPAFHRQQADFVAQWSAQGADIRGDAIAGHHHFSIIEELADPASTLTQWIAGSGV